MSVETLPIFVRDNAENTLLPWPCQQEATARFGVTSAQVEEVALERGILPARYQRNRRTFSVTDQLALFRSRVAVVGCGGLGGYIIEELARLGVGSLTVIDPDVFEEHNLNRQLFSTIANLGTSKVMAAVRRCAEINPAVTVLPQQCRLTADNGAALLSDCGVAVDALDSIPARRALADVCRKQRIPLVHGSIAGWYGHIATQLPGTEDTPHMFRHTGSAKGVEQQEGNPSFTPAIIASMEAAEVCKLILGKGTTLNARMLLVDLLEMEFHDVSPSAPGPEAP